LNLDNLSKVEFNVPAIKSAETRFSYLFELSQEIKIEKRIVTSLPSLFGEVGGLGDIINLLIALIIGRIQEKLFTFDQVRTFFKANISTRDQDEVSPTDLIKGRR